jgi:hypothetical protein
MDIKKIKAEGFVSKNHRGEVSDFAYLSLEIAFKAYSATYKSIIEKDDTFEKLLNDKLGNEDKDKLYTHEYTINCTETIIHLQHFFELMIKDSLRSEHELLATDAQEKPTLLYKLIKSKELTIEEYQHQKTVEFEKALRRLCSLIDNGLIDTQYHFINEYKEFLSELNGLRNRLLHRGIFVLRYEALDWLMIKFAVPLINELTERNAFVLKMIPYKWKPKPIDCGINPFKELPNCISNDTYDFKKVSLIKEMIRASYHNPIAIEHDSNRIDLLSTPTGWTLDNKIIAERAENEAKEALNKSTEWYYGNMIYRITKCPVCGVDSLLIYEDYNGTASDPIIKFNNKVRCCCCSFEIKNHIDIFGQADIEIEDFWKRKQ